MKKLMILAAAAAILSLQTLQAKVTFPSVISDNMVLQQNTNAALWGTAEPGKKVTITTGWSKEKTVVTADSQTGKWLARVATPSAGGPYEITVSDGEKAVLKNVLIGEVWFCSGQSNMEMPMKGYGTQPAKGAIDYILKAKASTPIRMCTIERVSSIKPEAQTKGSWLENTPENVASTSATAYYFAEYLQRIIEVPVGIIVSCWGGSSIEAWMNRETLESEFPQMDLSHLDGKREVLEKRKNQDPALLYNGMVDALVPFTFKGMIWYQGEANRATWKNYQALQTSYVKMMRRIFEVPEAPFYCTQIAPYHYHNAEDFHTGYLNEAQQKSVEELPFAGMAVTCDIGEYGSIHPCRKQQVGERLAYLALSHDYGHSEIVADAPTYKSVEFKDGKAYVTFNVDKLGLSPMGQDLPGFQVAGEDKVFKDATGRMYKNNILVISCPEVSNPVSVRYCFRNRTQGTFYNNFGIPVAPFRTDDWEIYIEKSGY